MSNTFQWTDELVLKFAKEYRFSSRRTSIEQFKSYEEPKKEWEIVAYRHIHLSKLDMGNCVIRKDSKHWPDGPNDDYEIWSVRRLADSEIFSVGDRLQNFKNPITRVNVGDRFVGGIGFECGDNGEGTALFAAKKLPAPILTTLDGVDIYPGQEFWGVSLDKVIRFVGGSSESWPGPNMKSFSTKELADDYVFNNRPLLSLNDVVKAYNDLPWTGNTGLLDKLTNLVKSKLNP